MRASNARMFFFAIVTAAIFAGDSVAQHIPDENLRARFEQLSAATLEGGDGWRAYEELLHPDYSRWAMGQVYEGREKFVRSLEEWWDYGMRVADRETELVGVDMSGDIAVIRFITTESFAGPDGPAPGFSGYVSNVWVREGGAWLLLSAEISAIENP